MSRGGVPAAAGPLMTGIVDLPCLSPAVEETRTAAESLFGLAERFIAVESAVYLAAQFRELKAKIMEFLPQDKGIVVQEYDEQVGCLRQSVCLSVCLSVKTYEPVVQPPSKCKDRESC